MLRIIDKLFPGWNLTHILDILYRNSFLTDIATGMQYLHHNSISHGNLKSSNCLVDNRFAVKITDYGLPTFRRHMKERSTELDVGEHEYYKSIGVFELLIE